jgi:hypothetical protein
MNLLNLENIHLNSELESEINKTFKKLSVVKGDSLYYHYKCDGFNDVGWGCGYRTLQSICSWISNANKKIDSSMNKVVPSFNEIQELLIKCGDKSAAFLGSRDWIGCFEVSYVIDSLYDVPCKILHCAPKSLHNEINNLYDHFDRFGSPTMMGGDLDNGSKGIYGIATLENDDGKDAHYLLVVDPHFTSNYDTNLSYLIKNKWIEWKNIDYFNAANSFYNFCMPQLKV